MADMVERVARAMAENAGFAWENCAQSQWRSDARAAIEAMKEPTDEMADRAYACATTDLASKDDFKSHYRDVWQSMIDAALTTNQTRG